MAAEDHDSRLRRGAVKKGKVPEISCVIPVYNEAKVLDTLVMQVSGAMEKAGKEYEIVFVDDGSGDTTWEILKRIAGSSDRVRAIRFTRNFGKESAIQAGLQQARGKAAVIMDADLQHPPHLLPGMIDLWEKSGYEVVEGVKTERQRETFLNRAGSMLFYQTLKIVSGFDLRKDTDFKLLDRKVIEAYLSLNEKGRFFRTLIPYLGFKTARIPFTPDERGNGSPRFSFLKRFSLAVTAITSFSSIPLHVVTLLGLFTFLFSLLLGAHTVYVKLSGKAVEGFTTVILVLLFIGSILMIALGIIGEYIARIFEEVKNRPSFVIAEITDSEQ
ncbi:MAG: glycosyltransferase family 2 protein [Nitrospirota bacterium]